MFCPKCGNQTADEAAFCHNCGTKLIVNDTQPTDTTAPKTQPSAESTPTIPKEPVPPHSEIMPEIESEAEEGEKYDLQLVKLGDSRVAAIKAIKASLGVELQQAKELAVSAPTSLKKSLSKAKAESIMAALTAVGATVIMEISAGDSDKESENKEGNIDMPSPPAKTEAPKKPAPDKKQDQKEEAPKKPAPDKKQDQKEETPKKPAPDKKQDQKEEAPKKPAPDKKKDQKSEKKDTQAPKSNNTGSFPLFGTTVNIPLELSNFNVFYIKYDKMARKLFEEFPAEYKKKFSNIEQVLDGYLALYEKHLYKFINVAIEDLIQNKVFDVDFDAFLKLHSKELMVYDAYDAIEAQYAEILGDKAAQNAYRTARRQSRGRWVGGGFGMQGAIKGAVQAGAFNAVGGLAHGTANVIGSAFSAAGASIRKVSLFNDTNTGERLMDAVMSDCSYVVFTLADILKKKGFKMQAVTYDLTKKADALRKNVAATSFPKAEVLPTMIKAILLNPYEEKYYQFLIHQFHDENGEVEALAKYFGIEIASYKSSLLMEFYNTLPVSTYKEAEIAKEKMIQHSKLLGGVPDELMNAIDSLIETRKNEYIDNLFKSLPKRTLDELLATREKIKAARREIKQSSSTVLNEIDNLILKCKNNMAMDYLDTLYQKTEEEMLDAKKKLLEYCSQIKLEDDNAAVAKIDAALQKVDKDIRTVEGNEFKTREEANVAKDESAQIQAIIARHELTFRWDYVALIDEIMTTAHSTVVSDRYIRQIQTALNKFDKTCRRAARHNYRRGKKFRIYSGDVNTSILHWTILLVCFFSLFWGIGIFLLPGDILYIFLISRRKEKKLWNGLTNKGMYDFAEIVKQ